MWKCRRPWSLVCGNPASRTFRANVWLTVAYLRTSSAANVGAESQACCARLTADALRGLNGVHGDHAYLRPLNFSELLGEVSYTNGGAFTCQGIRGPGRMRQPEPALMAPMPMALRANPFPSQRRRHSLC